MSWLSVSKAIRLSKAVILFTVALLAFFVVLGNTTDYGSNYNFVHHVMSMDTTYEGNTIMYRAITNPIYHHAFYIVIIFFEFIVMLLCAKGSYDLIKNINNSAEEFHKAKKFGVLGLLLCCLIWFFGFQVVAAEWFGMWMSKWNGLPDAFRLVTYMFLALIYITLKNDDE